MGLHYSTNSNYDDLFASGMHQYSLGNLEQAIEMFSGAIQLDPGKPAGYFQRGMCYSRMGVLSHAIDDFEDVYYLGNVELRRDVCYNLGKANEGLQKFKEALKWYDLCLDSDPNFANAYANRSVVYMKLADQQSDLNAYQLALRDVDQALNLNPTDYLAYYNRAIINQSLKNFESIQIDLEKFLEYAPQNHPYIQETKKLLAKLAKPSSSKIDKIRIRQDQELFEKILRMNTEKNYEGAEQLCDQYLEKNTREPVVWYEKVYALIELGRHQEALSVCENGIGANPGAAQLFYLKGSLLFEMKKYREAIGAYEKYLSIAPKEYEQNFLDVRKRIALAKQLINSPINASKSTSNITPSKVSREKSDNGLYNEYVDYERMQGGGLMHDLLNLILFIFVNVYTWFFLIDPTITQHIISLIIILGMGLFLINSGYKMYRKGLSILWLFLSVFAVLLSLTSIIVVRGFI